MAVSSSAQAVCGCLGTAAANAPITSNAAIPTSTHAIPVSGPAPTYQVAIAAGGSSAATTSAIKVSMQVAQTTSTKALSKFTGGAATAAGSIGGIMAAALGLIAAL